MKKTIFLLSLFLSSYSFAEYNFELYGGLGLFSDRIKEGGQLSFYYAAFDQLDIGVEYTQWIGNANKQDQFGQLPVELPSGDTRALKITFLSTAFKSKYLVLRPKLGLGLLEDMRFDEPTYEFFLEREPLLSLGVLVSQPITKHLSFALNTDAMFSSYSYSDGSESKLPTGFESIDISIGLLINL